MARFPVVALMILIFASHCYGVIHKIGVSPWDPMVICDIGTSETAANDGVFSGFSVELIRELTRKIGWARSDYEIVCYVWDDMLTALRNGTVDFLLSGVSITTADAQKYSFAQPEYLSGLRLLVKNNVNEAPAVRPFSFFDPFDLTLWLVFLATTIVLANLYWFFELSMGAESEVRDKYAQGFPDTWFYVLNGFVGEDPFIEIRTYMSRVIQFAYKFMVVILLATYTGSVAAIITVTQQNGGITGPGDIGGKVVATSDLQDNLEALRMYGANVRQYVWGTNEAGYAMVDRLKRGEVDAVALDKPFVDYVAAHDCSVKAVGSTFNLQNYGPTFRNGSESTALFQAVNLQVIDFQISGFVESLAVKYFPSESQCVTDDGVDSVKFVQVFGLWIILGAAIVVAFLMLFIAMIYYRRKSMFHNWKEAFVKAGIALSEAANEDEKSDDDDDTSKKKAADIELATRADESDRRPQSSAADRRPQSSADCRGPSVRDLERKMDSLEATVRQLIQKLEDR
eukprot:TRINITY_DN634_c1_g1_i8.p1 TRINITY_DN634_c1_g1~~TRINITY_DN634_c1_g1_i8.p1  ORF type:complete len:512 (-),score=176.24 TRINITY_DN634_c1_g1_i8:286-1821(-)